MKLFDKITIGLYRNIWKKFDRANSLLLSRVGLELLTKPLSDSIGRTSRTIYQPQSGLFDVSDYLTGDVESGTTVVGEEGTGSIALSEGRLDYTDTKYLWSFELSNGSTYEHPTIVGANAIWFDTSGNGRYLTGSVVDINTHCHSDDSLTFGSDHENQKGITISDGATYYLNNNSTGLIPTDTSIPALADGSGCAAYFVGGSVAPLIYPGRAKYNIELVNNACALFDGTVGDYLAFSGLAGTESVISSEGTATPTVSAGQIDCTAGTCSIIVLDNGWTIVLEEGEGTACYAYSGVTNITGTVHTSDVDTFWSGEKDGENHNYLYGYELSGSVKIPSNPNTDLSVLGNTLTVLAKRLTGQTWVNPECKELMDAELNMTLDVGGDNSAHTEEILFDKLGNAKEFTLTADGVELFGLELWDDTIATAASGFVYNGNNTWTAATTTSQDIYITNLTSVGSTAVFDLEILSVTAGSIGGKNRGTVDVSQRIDSVGRTTIEITDTSGFAHTGLESDGFVGTVKIHSVREYGVEEDNNFNNQVFVGPKGEAVYSERQTDSVSTEVLEILGVPEEVVALPIYYVSNAGNDDNDGLSIGESWLTINKVNNASFSPGDTVAFNRGDTWSDQLLITDSGTSESPITFGAYGSGDLPVFDGTGVTLTNSHGLIRAVSRSYITIEYIRVQDVGIGDAAENSGIGFYGGTGNTVQYCEIDYTESAGIKMNTGFGSKVLYCDVTRTNADSSSEQISISGVDGFEVAYCKSYTNGDQGPVIPAAGGAGIDSKGGSQNGTIHHNEVYDIYNGSVGIYVDAFSLDTSNIQVYSNYVHDVGAAGISIGSEDGGALHNVTVHHNIVEHAEYGGIVFHNVSHSGLPEDNDDIYDIFIYNNTLYQNGTSGTNYLGGVRVWDEYLVTGGVTFKNNILASAYNFQLGVDTRYAEITDVIADHNVIYGVNSGTVGNFEAVNGTNATTDDPLFTDPDNNDFTLDTGSPAIDAGLNSVWQGTPNILDYNGVAITDSNGDIVAPGGVVNLGAME